MEKITTNAIKSIIIGIGISIFTGFLFSKTNYFYEGKEISKKIYNENIGDRAVVLKVITKEEFNYKVGLISGSLGLLFFMFVYYDDRNKKLITLLYNLVEKINYRKKINLNSKNVITDSKFKKTKQEKKIDTNDNKTALYNHNKKLLLKIYVKNPIWFTDLIALNYPLNEILIERYVNLDWNYLLRKKNLIPDKNLIRKDKNYIWHNLSRNKLLPWSIEFIKKYKKKWNWHNLSKNESIKWSYELIEIYNDRWDWDITYTQKSEMFHYEINKMLLEAVKNEKISIEQFIRNIGDRWKEEYDEQFKLLENNYNKHVILDPTPAIVVSSDSLIDDEDDTGIPKAPNQDQIPDLSISLEDYSDEQKEAFEKNVELYTKLLDYFLPEVYKAMNSYEVSVDYVLEEILNISTPAQKQKIAQSMESFMEAWERKEKPTPLVEINPITEAQRQKLRKMANAKFSDEVLGKFHSIFEVEVIPNRIKEENKTDWYSLSQNETLQWSTEYIEKFKDNWDWKELTYNKSIQWSLELLAKYSENITKTEINWEIIKSYIDDDLIEMIFEMISNEEDNPFSYDDNINISLE